jgi:Fe2+ transport system protein FeoA
MNLNELDVGKKAIVKNIIGGHGLQRKLYDMGIRTGTEIIKISQHFFRGPVIIQVYNSQIAIGYGMACKIIVEEK